MKIEVLATLKSFMHKYAHKMNARIEFSEFQCQSRNAIMKKIINIYPRDDFLQKLYFAVILY